MPDKPLRIVQISDCHLLADDTAALHGWRNWRALDAILDHIRASYPHIDVLLATGDLVHDESPTGYRRLAQRLHTLGAAIIGAVPGNHDDPDALRSHMPSVTTTGPVPVGGWRLHLLNSHISGSNGGALGRVTMDSLYADLAANPRTPTLIALHHPPMTVGAAWLDTMRLTDGEALLQHLAGHRQAAVVTCGHVHQSFDARYADIRILCTPAVTRQFQPRSSVFKEDHRQAAGYRVFQLYPDGRFTTRVRRVPPARREACGQIC